MTDIHTFKTSQYEHITILTPLLESLNAANASWFKEELQAYLDAYAPRRLIVNLYNVQDIDSVGMGVLISLNSKSKRFGHSILMGLQPQVENKLKASRIHWLFEVITPDSLCPICGMAACEHKEELQEKQREFLAKENPVGERTSIKHKIKTIAKALTRQLDPVVVEAYGEEDEEEYAISEQQQVRTKRRQRLTGYLMIGFLSTFFVGSGALFVWIGMKSGINIPKSKRIQREKIMEKEPLDEAQILERFDKNEDGVVNKEDWLLLKSQEKLILINQGFNQRKYKFNKDKEP